MASAKEFVSVAKAKKQNEMGNLVEIKMVVTQGKALTLMAGLNMCRGASVVATDLYEMVQRADVDNVIGFRAD